MWGCREPKGEGEIGRREGGHPLKRQRGTGKGETRRRAKEDARRTREVVDQWEGRKNILGGKTLDKRGDWRGGNLRGRRTRVTMEREDDWGKEVWNGGKKSEWEERNWVTERTRVDWGEKRMVEFGPEEVGERDEAARAERADWGRKIWVGAA